MQVRQPPNVSAHITTKCLHCESRLHVCMHVSVDMLIHQLPVIVPISNTLPSK